MKLKTGLGLLALGALAAWGTSGARRLKARDLSGEVVLITGGSRGLGLCIARELARHGCKLALVARDPEELARAREDLVQHHHAVEVMSVPCDVADRTGLEMAVEQVLARFGRIDGLINVAGQIQVGPLSAMTLDDFRRIMEVNFYGALHATYAVLPGMRERHGGWIVNIDSIGGRLTPPHLLPYHCSKFALRGLSEGLDVELARDGIEVITVLPGLMRTGSPIQALFKGNAPREFLWFGLDDMLPLLSISAPNAARQVVSAVRLGKREVNLGPTAKLAGFIHDVLPGATLAIMEQLNRLMPTYEGKPNRAVPGRELKGTLAGPLVGAISRFGEQYNQVPRRR